MRHLLIRKHLEGLFTSCCFICLTVPLKLNLISFRSRIGRDFNKPEYSTSLENQASIVSEKDAVPHDRPWRKYPLEEQDLKFYCVIQNTCKRVVVLKNGKNQLHRFFYSV